MVNKKFGFWKLIWLIYLILAEVKDIWLVKYLVYNDILNILLVEEEIIVYWEYIKKFQNIIARL